MKENSLQRLSLLALPLERRRKLLQLLHGPLSPRTICHTSQRMKPVSFLLAFSLASPLLAARPVVETERITKDNAYLGVWLEIHQRLLHNL